MAEVPNWAVSEEEQRLWADAVALDAPLGVLSLKVACDQFVKTKKGIILIILFFKLFHAISVLIWSFYRWWWRASYNA